MKEKSAMDRATTIERAGRPNLDTLVAQLTEAAYPVALRHGESGSWVDLELDLWKALGRAVLEWERGKN
jgi:hypothetical protein